MQKFLNKKGMLLGLIKPQFEAKKNEVKKGGIIKDPLIHKRVCKEVENWLVEEKKMKVLDIIESSIKRPKGNIEYFVLAVKLT